MAEFLRHVGKTANTDRRVVVVYMQIPGRDDHALVVDTDALPSKYHDDLMTVIQGEAQKEPVLANILTRRIMPSTGVDMLTTLHQTNLLTAVPIQNIIMLPQPNRPVPLAKLVEFMNPTVKPEEFANQIDPQTRDNRIVENQAIDKDDSTYNMARNLIIEADMLLNEANRKRNQAYEMYPGLKPREAVKAAPVPEAPQVAEVPAEPKAKRTRSKKTPE